MPIPHYDAELGLLRQSPNGKPYSTPEYVSRHTGQRLHQSFSLPFITIQGKKVSPQRAVVDALTRSPEPPPFRVPASLKLSDFAGAIVAFISDGALWHVNLSGRVPAHCPIRQAQAQSSYRLPPLLRERYSYDPDTGVIINAKGKRITSKRWANGHPPAAQIAAALHLDDIRFLQRPSPNVPLPDPVRLCVPTPDAPPDSLRWCHLRPTLPPAGTVVRLQPDRWTYDLDTDTYHWS